MKRIITSIIAVTLMVSMLLTPLSGCRKKDSGDTSSALDVGSSENSLPDNESIPEESKDSSATSNGNKSAGTASSSVKVPDNMNLTGFPIAKKTVKLKIMVDTSAAQPDFSKVKMFQAYEKMTNVKIEWINIPSGTHAQR